MFWNVFLVVLVVAFILWVILDKKSPLAAVIRARFQGAKAKVTSGLDDAISRMDAAYNQIESDITKATNGLLEIKKLRNRVEGDLREARDSAAEWQKDAETSAKNHLGDLVKDCLSEKQTFEAKIFKLEVQVKKLEGDEFRVQTALDKLEEKKETIESQRKEIESRSITAEVEYDVNQMLAGLEDGQSDNYTKALELIKDAEAKAAAVGEVAHRSTRREDLKAQVAALPNQEDDLDDEAAELMSKYAKPDESANP